MKKFNILDCIAMVLVIIGGINWGLYGAFGIDLVELIIGMNIFADIIYVLVGLSAIYLIFACKCCKGCSAKPVAPAENPMNI